MSNRPQKDDIPPSPAYFPTTATSPLHPPTALYERLRNLTAEQVAKVQEFVIPPRSGRAWKVQAGEVWRLSTVEGPQVGDLNIWNAHNPRERFWAARTRQLQGSHVTEGDRLWSNLPYMRPLCGMIKDGCQLRDAPGNAKNGGREERRDERGGVTKWGGRCHDLLGTRCDPYVSNLLTSTTYNYHCHSNLVRAVLPYHLDEPDIHDVLNVFQVTGLDTQGRYFMEASPATADSYIDFFAERDILCALSTCPGGDLSVWGWGVGTREGDADARMKDTCRPIKVEVWRVREAVREEVLGGWMRDRDGGGDDEAGGYGGVHGMGIPVGEQD